jgi:hypothetical protein
MFLSFEGRSKLITEDVRKYTPKVFKIYPHDYRSFVIPCLHFYRKYSTAPETRVAILSNLFLIPVSLFLSAVACSRTKMPALSEHATKRLPSNYNITRHGPSVFLISEAIRKETNLY